MAKHKHNSEHRPGFESHIYGAFDGAEFDYLDFEEDFDIYDDAEYPDDYTTTSPSKTLRARDARKLEELYREDMELRDRLDEFYHHTDD